MTKKIKFIIIGLFVVILVAVTIALISVFIIRSKDNKADCQIYPFAVDPHPILVISGTSTFLYPKHGKKLLTFSSGQALDFLCPGQRVILGQSDTNNSILGGTCVTGNTFKIGNLDVDWKDFRCSNSLWRSIRYTGNNCENNGTEIESGFEVGDGRFIRSLLICFNQKLQVAYYTFINQTGSINQRVLGTPRPSFLQGSGFYDIGTVNNLYLRNNQRATINRLLGLPDNSTKYIQDTTNYFLARGHLTARSDGYYAAQQNATFFYQNIAPQWQTFNGFNWNQIEIDVRDYAEEKSVDLQVWTGVHGITTLPHEETNEPTKLYLFVNQTSNRKALPVPEIYWKVAYNPLTEKGIALIGVNNPFNTTFATICSDVSNRISWLHCNKDNEEQGFCYACYIDTFRRVVTSMPNIPDRGLLL